MKKIQDYLIRNPATLTKEIVILYELGLDPSEINYIILQREKEQASKKWD